MNLPVHIQLLLFVITWLQLTTANPNVMPEEGKIIGGHETTPHRYPFIVSLQTRFLYVRMHICGGALLNERFILSAAHCATESWLIRWLPLDAVAGVHDVNHFKAQTQVIQILERIPHPRYNGGIGPHDIALFKTVKPFIYTAVVQPIRLATDEDYKSGDSLKLLGWGALRTTTFIPDLPYGLQEVDVNYVPYEACYKAIEKLKESNDDNPLDDESNICTGPTTGGVAACVGDSGGPLVRTFDSDFEPTNDPIEDNTEQYNASLYNCLNNNKEDDHRVGKQVKGVDAVLLGVVSWGVSPCGEKGAPTVYTNVSPYKFFIEYIMKHE